MIKAKAKRRARSRDRDGYDVPLLLYLRKGTRAQLRKRHGPRKEAEAIRLAVAEHLAQPEKRPPDHPLP